MGIGTGTKKLGDKDYTDIHSAKYDFNDAALPVGASYWVNLVEARLPVLTPPTPPAAEGSQPTTPPPAGPKP
jgi:hypothetical protein